ncbi:MAG: transglycosylase domain-containing protein [Myxococcota bacterium]
MRQLDLHLRGEELGELRVRGVSGALDDGASTRLEARSARLGDDQRSLEVADPVLELVRSQAGWSLRSAAAESVTVVLGEAPREGWRSLLSALDPRTHARGRAPETEAPREAAPGAAPDAASNAAPDAASDAASAGVADTSALPASLNAWVGESFEGTLGALTVRARPDEEPLLDELHATLTVAAGRVATKALGRLSGGTLEWDLALEPDARRAEGRLHVDALPLSLIEPLLTEVPLYRPESARFSADVRLDRAGDGLLTLEGSASLRGVALSDPAIAPVPVRDLDLAWQGTASWNPERRRLEVEDSTLTLRGVESRWRAELELGDARWSARVRATLPPTRCNDAVGAIPEDLLQDAAGFRWTGSIGGQLRFAARSDELDATRLEVNVANGCLFESVPAFADLRRLQGPFVHRVREPDGRLFEMSAGPGTANWSPLHVTSPFLVHAVLGHEDGAFLRHPGFSVGSIRDALVRNLEAGGYRRGGSTITMQLAKNVFLHREKTLARKAQEVLLTWWLETALPKDELLALYLNLIEYGPGIYGIKRAAEHYFGRHPSELTVAESAYLACILPDPKGFHAQWQAGRPPERMRRRVGRFLRVIHERGRIDAAALADGLAQLEELRFHRVGRAPSAWPQTGRARSLPFATSVVGDPFEAFLAPEDPEPGPPADSPPLEQF